MAQLAPQSLGFFICLIETTASRECLLMDLL